MTTEQIQVKSIAFNSVLEARLFKIYNATVRENLNIDQIRNRYHETYQVNIIFLKNNGIDIGFAMITFYKTQHQNKTIFLARPAMGILNSARGAKFPMVQYIKAFIHFKLKHPFNQVMLFTCPVNPIPFAASSKYWKESYPKYNHHYPKSIQAIKQTALRFFGETEIRENILQLPYGPLLDRSDIDRFYERQHSNPHVAYFLEQNPNFLKNESLILMIPVHFKNIVYILKNQLLTPFKKGFSFAPKKIFPPKSALPSK